MSFTPDARVQVIFQCPPDMRDKLHALAKREGETTASILRRMVSETLRANDMAIKAPMKVGTFQVASV